jgi:hypothetical protein
MPYPKPDGYVGSGADGTLLATGSAGHLGVPAELDEGRFDALNTDTCNPNSLDTYSGTGSDEKLQ